MEYHVQHMIPNTVKNKKIFSCLQHAINNQIMVSFYMVKDQHGGGSTLAKNVF